MCVFFVVGTRSPWELVEVNVETGRRLRASELAGGSWEATWRCLTLAEARETLHAWLGQLEVEAVEVEGVEVEAEVVEEEAVEYGHAHTDF